MNIKYPIYTEKTECQDCYKCVRHCPVKAIKVEQDSAIVEPELCIFCGKCVDICPVKAKKIRNDIPRARQLLSLKEKVIVSLAPTYVTEFPMDPRILIHALKELGFYGVSETSLGAQILSTEISRSLQEQTGLHISTACPSIVEAVTKYYPELIKYLSPYYSPLCAHARFLKRFYEKNIAVIFIGPCIAKKLEADNNPELVDLALTFQELREWLTEENVSLATNESFEHESFIPVEAGASILYSIEGGMLATLKKGAEIVNTSLMSFSGIDDIFSIFDDMHDPGQERPCFLELLSCKGGCINGPAVTKQKSLFKKRARVIDYYTKDREKIEVTFDRIDIMNSYTDKNAIVVNEVTEESLITKTLQSLGKYSPEDELNCGGCGYYSCRDFAEAVINRKAEIQMCVTRMRKIAQKKINALIKTIPMGVVIVDDRLRVVDSNERFLKIFTDIDFRPDEGFFHAMEGQSIEKFMPYTNYIQAIQNGESELIEEKFHYKKKVLQAIFFSIEESTLTGAIFHDITYTSVKRDTVIRKTEEVIKKNLESVQQIASLLGENAAETEIILNSLIDTFDAPATSGR